jgi:probable phosphoglycerate mutase
MIASSEQQVWVVRHGETEWSLNGRHTGVTDLPLTANGRAVAALLKPRLAEVPFAKVLVSPLRRARETCELAGLGGQAVIENGLKEWDYGEYEGLTIEEIDARQPGWMIFRDGCPAGETPAQIGARVDRVIARVRETAGNVALFAHGHVLRVLAARWIGLGASGGQSFCLDTATLGILAWYRTSPAVRMWNAEVERAEERH